MAEINYTDKARIYFTKPRLDLISLMAKKPVDKVLEIGMGGGDTLVEIKKQGLATEVVGVDLMELPGSNQHHPSIDKTIFINLDSSDIDYPDNYFDVIIAGDVLEHLTNPWQVLKRISQKLKKGGYMLISIPNIREFTALKSIFCKGSFAYAAEGIFDKTHVRFFCRKDMEQLIVNTPGLTIEMATPIHLITAKNSKREIFNKFTFKLFEEFTSVQYLFKVVKSS